MTDAKSLQPIRLVLIDFNMPIMSGFEAITAIKKKFEEFNEERARKDQIKVYRPFFCMFSQGSINTIQQFMYDEEQPECYLEKPVQKKELEALLKLLNISK